MRHRTDTVTPVSDVYEQKSTNKILVDCFFPLSHIILSMLILQGVCCTLHRLLLLLFFFFSVVLQTSHFEGVDDEIVLSAELEAASECRVKTPRREGESELGQTHEIVKKKLYTESRIRRGRE